MEEHASLTVLEASWPDRITMRVLWRVAQSQYDPLGLLSVGMVKWMLIMRKVALKGKEGGRESPLDQERRQNSGVFCETWMS